ncbi:ChbG/HpnK family deacetylase [Candidatus Woesearchaeota archaeon]|nr:ChbG/HpnK family deacetylase [Candidatus Woesearchaeota archaeon]
MQRLIINADDFGFSREVNEGIIEAHQFGTVTSTSIMSNERFFEHAVDLYPKTLGIGIHLNLTWGNTLTNGKAFDKKNKYRAVLGTINKNFVRKELEKQIERVFEVGITPDHLDSHQHLHAFQPITNIVIDLAKEFHIPKIRWQKEKTTLPFPIQPFINQQIINWNMKKCPLTTTDNFFGTLYTGRPAMKHFLSYLNFKGSAEICSHPGKKSYVEKDKLYKTREREFKILTSENFKNKIQEKNIQLISFREL